MDWNKIKKKELCRELKPISVMLLIVVISALVEVVAKTGHSRLFLNRFDDISLVIIQIQATVETLSIALLAIMCGHIDRSYMGIRYTDFIMNIKPCIFKQNRIIYCIIALLVFNVFMHMAGCYNIVTGCFILVCVLIIVLTKEVYSVFSLNNKTKKEIENYIRNFVKDGANYTKKIEMLSSFIDDWTKNIEKQSEAEFENEETVFGELFETVFKDKTLGARNTLKKECSTLASVLLKSKRLPAINRGLLFLYWCYNTVSQIMLSEKETIAELKDGFHLFCEVYNELRAAIFRCSMKAIEEDFQWERLMAIIVDVNYSVAVDENEKYELEALNDFMADLGRCVSNRYNEINNINVWRSPLKDLCRFGGGYLQYSDDDTIAQISEMRFRYALSLICNNRLDILKDSLYLGALNHIYMLDTNGMSIGKHTALLIMKTHCYIYYIAERESDICVTNELKVSCKNFLENSEVKKAFKRFLDWISDAQYDIYGKEIVDNDHLLYNDKLIEKIYIGLRRYEAFPPENSKTLIMEDVVRDFVIFTALYMQDQYNIPFFVTRIIPEDRITEIYQYYHNNASHSNFERLLRMLDDETSQDILEFKVNYLCSDLDRHLSGMFKSVKIIEISKEAQKSEFNKTKVKEDTETKVIEYLNNKFEPIISDEAKDGSIIQIPLIELNTLIDSPIDSPIDSFIAGQYVRMAEQLIEALCVELKKSRSVHIINKTALEEESYIEYLEHTNLQEIIGSRRVFYAGSYVNHRKIEESIKSKAHIMLGYGINGLLLKKGALRIYIKRVTVSIDPCTIDKSRAEYIEENGFYKYDILGDMPAYFTKNELESYLDKTRRIITISAEISIRKEEGIIGDMVCISGKRN